VSDFHRLLLAGLPGALRKILDTTNRRFAKIEQPPMAPLAALRLGELAVEAGVPPGVVNVGLSKCLPEAASTHFPSMRCRAK
jgi:hypothetical protein